jgi:branched-chain amino acid transport system permease protein
MRGTTGRKLRALRGSEVASQAVGISPGRNLLLAFAVSGFVAGLGGAMMAIHQENVNYGTNFSPFVALFWLVLVVTFAAREPVGAIAAAVVFALFTKTILEGELFTGSLRGEDGLPSFFPLAADWRFILFGLGAIQYARNPEGLLVMGRAGILRLLGGGRDRPEPHEPAPDDDGARPRPSEVEVVAS